MELYEFQRVVSYLDILPATTTFVWSFRLADSGAAANTRIPKILSDYYRLDMYL